MTTTKLKTSDPTLQKAEQVASQVFDDVDHLTFLKELPTKERTYQIVRTDREKVTTVTINPDLTRATLEWTRGTSKYGTAYRTFKIQDLVI